MASHSHEDDDRPPPAKSARVSPASRNRNLTRDGSGGRAKPVDPRFDPMFGGPADPAHFEKNYKFLIEMEEEEETRRRFRIRCLKCVLRRHELEEARAARRREVGSRKVSAKQTTEEEEEDEDLDAYEREVFGEPHADELRALKLTPPARIYRELEQLQRETQLYVSRRKNNAADARRRQVKKELMKKEVGAVKAGTKARPFFPKRAEVKRAVLSDRFDQLEEKGGKGAVDRYLARKR